MDLTQQIVTRAMQRGIKEALGTHNPRTRLNATPSTVAALVYNLQSLGMPITEAGNTVTISGATNALSTAPIRPKGATKVSTIIVVSRTVLNNLFQTISLISLYLAASNLHEGVSLAMAKKNALIDHDFERAEQCARALMEIKPNQELNKALFYLAGILIYTPFTALKEVSSTLKNTKNPIRGGLATIGVALTGPIAFILLEALTESILNQKSIEKREIKTDLEEFLLKQLDIMIKTKVINTLYDFRKALSRLILAANTGRLKKETEKESLCSKGNTLNYLRYALNHVFQLVHYCFTIEVLQTAKEALEVSLSQETKAGNISLYNETLKDDFFGVRETKSDTLVIFDELYKEKETAELLNDIATLLLLVYSALTIMKGLAKSEIKLCSSTKSVLTETGKSAIVIGLPIALLYLLKEGIKLAINTKIDEHENIVTRNEYEESTELISSFLAYVMAVKTLELTHSVLHYTLDWIIGSGKSRSINPNTYEESEA